MTSNSSKAIPYIVLLILITTIFAEGYFGIDIDLESYIPILIPMGLGGAGLAAIKAASEARKKVPTEIEDLIKDQARRLKGSAKEPTD